MKLLGSRLKKQKSIGKRQHAHFLFKRASVILAAIIIIFSIMLGTVSAFRIQVCNFVLGITDKYTSLQLQDADKHSSGNQMIVDWKNTYAPTYMPDGYEADDILNTDTMKSITYKSKENNNLDIVYTEYDSSSTIELDTEAADVVKTVSINDNKGTLIVKDTMVTVGWTVDNKMFTVMGQVDENLIMQIAKSVQYVT